MKENPPLKNPLASLPCYAYSMSSFPIDVATLALGTLIATSLVSTYLWIRGKSKPSFSFSTAKAAYDAILISETVFKEVQNQSGNMEYPWKVRGDLVFADAIRHSLLAAMAAIGKKHFSNSIKRIAENLQEIETHAYVSYPQVYSLADFDPPETPHQKKKRKEKEIVASIQLTAAAAGLLHCKEASERLNSLSKNL